jgi:iron complex outermembrane receptor protein
MTLKKHYLRSFSILGIASMAATVAPLASGQGGSSADVLQEIVVTARKRAESLQEVPVAVTALSGEDLRLKGVTRPDDLKYHTPGLEIRNQSIQRNSITYFIRGQGQTFGSSPSVVTYFAEAPLGNTVRVSIGNNSQLFDLESVQVLKGPQGTLFGRSSTGGAVLFEPRKPSGEFGGYIEQTIGSYDWRETRAAVDIPLIEGVLNARLAGSVVRRDGFTKTINTGQHLDDRNRDNFRLGLTFTPTEWLDSYLMYARNEVDENNSGTVLFNFLEGFPIYNTTPGVGLGWFAIQGLCGAINPGNPAGAQSCAGQRIGLMNQLREGLIAEEQRVKSGGDDAKRKNVAGAPLIFKGKTDQLLNITSFNLGEVGFLGDVTVKNIFSTVRNLGVRTKYDGGNPLPNGLVYNNFDFRNFEPVGSSAADGSNDWLDDYSEEFQISGDIDGKHSWILGYYQEVQKFDLNYPPLFATFANVFSPSFSPTVVGGFSTNQREEQIGYFAQTSIDLSDWLLDGLHLTLGYRYTETESTRNTTPIDQLALALSGNLVPGPVEVSRPTLKDSAPSWTAGLDWQINADVLVYITHRRGFKPGGSNVTAVQDINDAPPGFVLNYDPETVDDVELGIKADWTLAGRPVRTNAAVYQMWYEDIQRSESIGDPFGAPTTQVNNIAKAEIFGAELTAMMMVSDRLQVSLNYSYIDPEYTEWPGTTTSVLTGETLLLEDSPYVGTPEHQGTLTVRYTVPLADEWGEVALMADYYRQSSVWLNDTALADGFGKEDPYGNLNLRADWFGVMGSSFDFALFVRNATDELHAVAYPSFYAFVGTAGAVYNEPRMWGAQLRYRFGSE